MNNKSRITSILQTPCLDTSVTGLPTFSLTQLDVSKKLIFSLPTNVRLGHLAEKVVSETIKLSKNYNVLYENIQILKEKKTIGELDFIIQEVVKEELMHLEIAYKFYLYDPSISSEVVKNWIGPNRNDSLYEKLEKLNKKQFPLLYHNETKSRLAIVNANEISQALCLLVNLFIPYRCKEDFLPVYQRAVKGYYIDYETFGSLDNSHKNYFIPPRKEWGIDPSENEAWSNYNAIKDDIEVSIREQQAALIWQKEVDTYSQFFLVWW